MGELPKRRGSIKLRFAFLAGAVPLAWSIDSLVQRDSSMSVAKLKFEDEELEMPIVVGSEGERGIDIGKLRGKTGLITLDDGYINTGSCESAITFLDGEEGILRYRGYPIEVCGEVRLSSK